MKNAEIAAVFFEIADILEMQNVQWKPRAYRKAALAIESLAEPIEEILNKGGRKALEEIPGIGENISKKIEEIIKTGKLRHLEELRKQLPIDVEALNAVPGLGPKKLMVLYKKLGVKNLESLKKAALGQKVRKLAGFGEKTEEEILKGIELAKKSGERMLLGIALPIAEEITRYLKKNKRVLEAEAAGSLRRRMETIGDIDILVASKNAAAVMDYFCSMPSVKEVLAKGSTKASVRIENNLQVDVRVIAPEQWGSALQYFTGSKQHSIELRKIAMKKKLKLSEYGVFKGSALVASKTEKEVYRALGLSFIEPELRENRGEIEAALRNKLPKLIEYHDVNGDFQMHSRYSDGNNTIEEMAAEAEHLGHKFIAITDHVGSLAIAHAMDKKTIERQFKEIGKVQEKFPGLKIFKGMEVDIKKNGELDASNDVLKSAEIVYGSIHHGFKGTEKENTERICRAFESGKMNVLGHPTGRKINERQPIALDLERVFEKALQNNVVLEINAMPDRLDLNDVNAKAAIDAGCKLAIGTDAHSANQLRFLELGIATARRAWAGKKDIANAWELKKIERLLQK